MKKFVTKLLTVILAFSLVFSVLALGACGSGLDDVEKSIIGAWDDNGKELIFNEDGTFDFDGYHYASGFKHTGDGTDPERGHYEIITGGGRMALFDTDKDRLYFISPISPLDAPVVTDEYITRKQ